ncbi:MAG TPA: ATP-binding protein [Acidimicrobiales bacterium]|nr:ATP-binding protein [Acidimicrobiales bacterium]
MFRHIRSKLVVAFAVPFGILVVGAGFGAVWTTRQVNRADSQASLSSAVQSLKHSAGTEALFFLALCAFGLLVGLAVVALMSRSVSRPLSDLARKAEEAASTVLPSTVQAILAAGASGGERPSVPQIVVKGSDEVAELARALDAVNRTAVDLAVAQAELRQNLSEAFVNLGRRNQNLLTRQLEYISEIELKESDPTSLDELFRLDHLATRMRRNAESLLILAGSGPSRQWSQAVPAMDVARAASAEVEDYKRLRLHHFDAAQVAGTATTDLVHILAELIENALTFSPPGSTVDIYGRFLEGSYVIVIVDSGIGMAAADLDTANHRLSGLGNDVDVPGRYLGHFVAGKLAARHALGITLQSSQSGGIVARVKIPAELIEDAVPDLSALAEAQGQDGQPARLNPASAPRPAAPSQGEAEGASRFNAGLAADFLQGVYGAGEPGVFEGAEEGQPEEVEAVERPTPLPRRLEAPAAPPDRAEHPAFGAEQPPLLKPGVPGSPQSPSPSDAGPSPITPFRRPAQAPAMPGAAAAYAAYAAAAEQAAGGQTSAAEAARQGWAEAPEPPLHVAVPPSPRPIAPDLGIGSPLAAAPPPPSTAGFAWHPETTGETPAVGPAEQARTTAAALRKLTRRVPGAALEAEDGSLRRKAPTKTTRTPRGVAGAVTQYLSATAPHDGRAEKLEKEQDAS